MDLKKRTAGLATPESLPEPEPHRAGSRRVVVWAVLILLVVAGTAFWLTREPETRETWRKQAADTIDTIARDTPLAGMGNMLRAAPPPPPVSVTHPATAPGTLSGQVVQGAVTPAGQDDVLPLPMSKVSEDSRVRPAFIDDLAGYVVSRYKPGQSGGTLNLGVQSLNQRYGLKLAGQAEGGRSGLLRYAFHPAMIQGLYGLYVERFIEGLGAAAVTRGLTPTQTRQMELALAGRCVTVAGALEGIASLPDLSKRLKQLEQISENAVDINAQMTEAIFELDTLRESKADTPQLATARLRVDGLSARYRGALEERAAVRRMLVGDIRKAGGQTLDEDSLLFLAEWMERRTRQGLDAPAAALAIANVLRDLARRCAQHGIQAIGHGADSQVRP